MKKAQPTPLSTDKCLGRRLLASTEGHAIDPWYFISGKDDASFKAFIAPHFTHTWRVPLQFPSPDAALTAFRNPSFVAAILWRMTEEWLGDDAAFELVEHIKLPEDVQAQIDDADLTTSQFAALMMATFQCEFMPIERSWTTH
ncbi:hypothetical protein [Marinobacter sp. MBR-105]|jgi:hypothetical protein